MKLVEIITEIERSKIHEYGCAMLFFAFPEMTKMHKKIDPEDVYTVEGDESFGLEDEPHVTLLYGFHSSTTTDDIVHVLDKFTFKDCEIKHPSLFSNDEYDVLKFDVSGDNLDEVNKELSKFPHTSDYPDYHPHMTIAYLKKGKGKKYVEMFKKYKNFWITPRFGMYSRTDGKKDRIKLNLD